MSLKCLCCCGELVQRRLLLQDTPLRCADCGCEFDEDELAEYCSGGMVRVADIAGNSSGDLVLSAETGAEKILLGGLAAGCAACFAGMFFIPALFAVLLMLAGCGAFRLYSLCSGGGRADADHVRRADVCAESGIPGETHPV
ncbi:MAG: hypothetical protein HPZ91_08850 [Lentisphaeria bacterium]|nr:hypothetical protein [Lentisphaeria bacterium]